MKFSEKWLREWVNPNIDSTVLHRQIIDCGIEIESVDQINPTFKGIIVGKIIKCLIHPKNKKLKVVTVDIGKKITLNIVCGSINCRNNIKVAVATVGSILPNHIMINLKKIKGEWSEGMLCSLVELGLCNYNNDIIECPDNIIVGTNIKDYLSLNDNIIKISVTPNRIDNLSILGIARNIAVINNLEKIKLIEKKNKIIIQDQLPINIRVKNENINFFGRIIKNINIKVNTPFWMQKKLFFCNLLSDNIITNIINYILIEIGQPLNILNLDNINKSIEICLSKGAEVLNIKNQTKLDSNILFFSDINKILFIPGNFNSHIVEINNNTNNIFLCSYYLGNTFSFDMFKKMNLPNNRFLEYYNYGIDTSLQKYAIEYATYLIVQICGGYVGPISYSQTEKYYNYLYVKKIKLNHEKINKLVGCFINVSVILNILLRLEYTILDVQKNYWLIIPPYYRFDIFIEEDVISDILRIYNYNKITLTPLKENLIFNEKKDIEGHLLDRISSFLVYQGYYEVVTYSFVDPNLQSNIFPNIHQLLISNPISKEFSAMRCSLWPGLLKTVAYNIRRKQNSIRFFECGFCFSGNKKENLGVQQEKLLSGVISGFNNQENWISKQRKLDFYDLKGELVSILKSISDMNNIEFKPKKVLGLHPGQCANIYVNNIFIGSVGKIDPRLAKTLGLFNSTFLFELSFKNILNFRPFKIKKFSKFPTSRRDIAILIKKDISFFHIIQTCKKCFLDKIVDINLFDVYFSQDFSSDKRSLSISFIFQDKNKTLEEHEINLMMEKCIKTLKDKFHISLRT